MTECHKCHQRDRMKGYRESEDRRQGESKIFKLLMKDIESKIP